MMADLESNHIPEEAKKLLEQGDWTGAIRELDRALQSNPRQMSLWREKANTLVVLNQRQEALACYERMLEIDSSVPWIHAEKAEVLETLDRDAEALESYDRALQLAPSEVTFLKAKAQLLIRLARIPEAIALYDRILELRPQDPEFLIAKGDALISAGQIDQAVVAYFEQAARISPESFGAEEWTNRGGTLFDAGKADKALQFYDMAIQADPKYAWAYRGKALVLRGRPEKVGEALECLDSAIALDPKNAWFQLEKGNIHYDRSEYEAAAGCYATALEIDPKYQVAWRNLGLAQESLSRYDQAVVSAEKAIELDPQSADGWLHKGFCLGHLQRPEESMAAYRKALELEPENFWVNNNMGWTLSQMHKNGEALPFYQTAIKLDPTEAAPWVNQASSLIELGRPADALNCLKEGLTSVSEKRDVLSGIGFIYTEYLYQHDKALGYYEQRLQLDPSSVEVRINVAECLIKLGRVSEGRTEAEKLVGQTGKPEDECGLSLDILAAFALEGNLAGRARQFEVVVDNFKIYCPEGKPKKQESGWNFSGLVNTIRSSSISAESKFLVLTAIDVHQGKLTNSALSFFNTATPQTVETTADSSVVADAEATRQVPP